MFKSSLLTTVTTLLHAIKTESSGLSDLLVPLIQDSLSPVVRYLTATSLKQSADDTLVYEAPR